MEDLKKIWKKDEEKRRTVYFDALVAFKQNIQTGCFRGESSLDTYFKGIFRNKCNDNYRKRETIITSELIEDLPPHLHEKNTSIHPSFADNTLSIALDILKKENLCYANLIQLVKIDGRSFKEIVDLDMGCNAKTEGSLRNTLVDAVNRLRVILKKLD